MPYDRNLIREAQIRATGATIHAVANLLVSYIGKCELLARCSNRRRLRLEEEVRRYEDKLRRFIITGRIHE
jgi:hypothetical protein